MTPLEQAAVLIAESMSIKPDVTMTGEQAAEFRERFETAAAEAHSHLVPYHQHPLGPDEIRQLLRECVTVVKPGEILVIMVPANFTPNQLRDYQDHVTWWLEENAPGIKCLVAVGDGGQIVRQEPRKFEYPVGTSPIPPFGKWRDLVGDVPLEPQP